MSDGTGKIICSACGFVLRDPYPRKECPQCGEPTRTAWMPAETYVQYLARLHRDAPPLPLTTEDGE